MPFSFTCDTCSEAFSYMTAASEHIRDAHPGVSDEAVTTDFISQFEAQHGRETLRETRCPRCAGKIRLDSGAWFHLDGSEACVDPDAMVRQEGTPPG